MKVVADPLKKYFHHQHLIVVEFDRYELVDNWLYLFDYHFFQQLLVLMMVQQYPKEFV
jgi:hypothetical protein